MATLGLFGDAISHAVLPVWQCAGCSAIGTIADLGGQRDCPAGGVARLLAVAALRV